jgi:fimbrial chaperone protein
MNNYFKTGAFFIWLLLFLPFTSQAAGGVALGATRVIYPAGAQQTSLAITNSDSRDRYLINAWIDNDAGKKDKRFVVTPPLFVSEPKSENTLRIIYVGEPLPDDRESLFWMNVKAIPAVDKNSVEGKNVLQLAILSRIKLFVRPPKLSMQPEEARAKLSFSRSGGALVIDNPTPYYVTLVNLKMGGVKLPNTMISPRQNARVSLGTAQGSITFQTVNDYGALTPVQSGAVR